MTELPTGTVTLLFSDIEGSTALLSRLGADYVVALDGQREVLRRAWAAHGGVELGTEGDSFYVVFATAPEAVAAAVQAQRELADFDWPAAEKVRVRIGMHTGNPTVHDGAYVGMDVHRAARIAGAAHGGQVVLSSTTAELVAGSLGQGVLLRDLGSHQLRDLERAEHLFYLVVEGLEPSFAPLRTLGAATNLPVTASPLLGRDAELHELSSVLSGSQARLVTLTGTGGSGKTRLAVAVAARLVGAFPDGVYFVPLAAVTHPEGMWAAIGEVVGMPPDVRTVTGLLSQLAQHRGLMVLDNLEQLEDAGLVVAQLLGAAPHVTVIATSRRPLHLDGEFEYPVPPLTVPQATTKEDAGSSGAVQLFVQRAQMVRPSFVLSATNAADIVQICRRLDGLPLAIELAAARTKLLGSAALLARLDRCLDLRDARVDRPSRQQTLRDTISWSYDLLDAESRALFRTLGVFAGGAELEAIEVVWAGRHVGPELLDPIADLVDASLVTVVEQSLGEPRVNMLQTIRDFAQRQLVNAAEFEPVSRRHAEHFVRLAETAQPRLVGVEQVGWVSQLRAEHDNLAVALAWSTGEAGDVDLALRLVGALWHFWEMSGALTEGRRWLRKALASADSAPPELQYPAFCGAGTLAWAQGDHREAAYFHQHALDLSRRVGDRAAEAFSLNALGAQLHYTLDYVAAQEKYEQAMAIALDIGEQRTVAITRHNLADIARHRGDYATAATLYEDALRTVRPLGDYWLVTGPLHGIAVATLKQGDLTRAAAALYEGLDLASQSVENAWVAELLEAVAGLAKAVERPSAALRLLGSATALRERIGTPIPIEDQADNENLLSELITLLPAADYAQCWDNGKRMTAKDAVEVAKAIARDSSTVVSASARSGLADGRADTISP